MLSDELIRWLHKTPVDEIKKYASKLEGIIEELVVDFNNAYKEDDRETALSISDEIKEKKQLYRMIRGYYDILFFTYEYFSEERNEENETNLIPKGVEMTDAPEFHYELADKLDELVEKPTKKIGWASPRGSGKSAYLSNIKPTHATLYRLRKYILIISETMSMAQNFLEFVSTNLKNNPKIVSDFGEVLSRNTNKNEVDNNEAFVTATEIKVEAKGIQGHLRGSRFKNTRPQLILLDDVESAKNTNTQDLREKNLHVFNSVIEPMGVPEETSIIYMGTLVHGQGLLPDVLNRPEYDSAVYSSIISEPVHTEMWDKLENILRDVEKPNRLADAEAYYYENKDIMDEGIEVLWEERFPYLSLIKKKVDIGSRAFASEYLNMPSDEESAIFKEDYFTHFDEKEIEGRHLEVYGFWDIAMGKNKRSDYNAVVIIGRDAKTGVIYVLEAWGKKCPPSEAMAKALDLIERYRPKTFGVESISAQFEFYRQLQDIAMQRGYYFTRIKPVNIQTNKGERIESLEPLFEKGVIKTKQSQRLLHEMLMQYPQHPHDDLPDCLASALGLTRLNKKRAFYTKPDGI